ncbi:uncharacterized protein isoform X2 [Leptinotarsa decemlineata]|uniref:uncharacterized protein isoform X2 n=1 Tax=Leptinotarsa decemlineata TaxID=7539 RepID=UPI003D30CDFA
MTSKLFQMQARFQQKQMQEREEKLLKLYENQQQRAFERVGRGSAGSNTSLGSTGGGKVRQMFDERRQKGGIDKSYPLEPLKPKVNPRGGSLERKNLITKTTVRSTVQSNITSVKNGKPLVKKREVVQRLYNNVNGNESYEEHRYEDEGEDNHHSKSHREMIDMMNNHNLNDSLDNEVMPQIGFDEVDDPCLETKVADDVVVIKEQKKKSNVPPVAKRETKAKSSAKAPLNTRPSAKQSAKSPVVRDDLAECNFCGRRFAADRIQKHEDICSKTGKKKRKAYDATKHRVLGTELESYVLKPGKAKPSQISSKSSKQPPKKDWRRTHEEFIAAIRSAKEAQAHLAKGGKLSDLPPPPPSSNPDYVQCPHCGRRFNAAAAERHIPKCSSYQFNKPKPGAPPKGRPANRK